MTNEVLLFIHGTGVRAKGRAQTVARIVQGLAEAGQTEVRVDFVDWGEKYGTKVDEAALKAVLPLADTMGVQAASESEIEAARWSELLNDPYFELRMASIRVPARAAPTVPIPGGATKQPEQEMDRRLQELATSLPAELPGGVPRSTVLAATERLRREPVLREAVQGAGKAEDPDLARAVARAIVALTLRELSSEPGEGPEALFRGDLRKALVDRIAEKVAPPTLSIGGWLADKVKGFAMAKATRYGLERRTELMRSAHPGIGDILLYQRRGGEILDAIEAKIIELSKSNGKIVVMGHSLGGIMLVDLLSRPRESGRLPVAKLITVGSQAPALYKFDALGDLRLEKGMPFTPWLNFYDRNDFLSFCAERAFQSGQGIQDVPIASEVPFPEAHSAYFYSARLYEEISKFWAA